MPGIVEKTKEKLAEYEKRHLVILNAAIRLFNAKGYAATTTAKIAKEAGITEKTLYRHFKNKEALFAACVLSITEDLVGLWQNALDKNKEGNLAYLEAMVSSYVDFVLNNPDQSMFLVHLYSYRVIPELDEGFRNSVEDRLDEMEKVIRSMQETGVIKLEAHPRLIAGMLIGQYFTAVFLNEFLGPELYNVETAMDLTRHFLGID